MLRVPFIAFWCLILSSSQELNPLTQRLNLKLAIRNSPLTSGYPGPPAMVLFSYVTSIVMSLQSWIFRSTTSLIERSISTLRSIIQWIEGEKHWCMSRAQNTPDEQIYCLIIYFEKGLVVQNVDYWKVVDQYLWPGLTSLENYSLF